MISDCIYILYYLKDILYLYKTILIFSLLVFEILIWLVSPENV